MHSFFLQIPKVKKHSFTHKNSYSQIIQKKDEGVEKKRFLYIENAA